MSPGSRVRCSLTAAAQSWALELQRGLVEDVGPNVRGLKKGDEVFFGFDKTQKDLVSFEGKQYVLTPATSVLAKIEDDAFAEIGRQSEAGALRDRGLSGPPRPAHQQEKGETMSDDATQEAPAETPPASPQNEAAPASESTGTEPAAPSQSSE